MRVFKTTDSKLNMCGYCLHDIPTCPKATVIEFGNGKGNDNVVACSEYVGTSLTNNIPIELDKERGIVK